MQAALPAGRRARPDLRPRSADRGVGPHARDEPAADPGRSSCLVIFVFLFHLRVALVAAITLPVGRAAVRSSRCTTWASRSTSCRWRGSSSRSATWSTRRVVLVENAHKKIAARAAATRPRASWSSRPRASSAPRSSARCSCITIAFLPVFALEAQEGRLFRRSRSRRRSRWRSRRSSPITLVPGADGHLPARAGSAARRRTRSTALCIAALPAGAPLRAPASVRGGRRGAGAPGRRDRVSLLARSAREFMPPLDEGDPALHADHRAGHLDRGGAGACSSAGRELTSLPRGRARVRQGRTRRDRDRSGAALDVRDRRPAQAAGALAPRDDDREV